MNTAPSHPESAAPNPERSEIPGYVLVLCSGLGTTALTLFGIHLLDIHDPDFHIMGWYAEYVIPAGAFLVGVLAATGYGLASWLSGIKIVRGLFWAVLFLQVAAYFAAQYVEFKHMDLVYTDTQKPVGFFEYFDMNARAFAWKQEDGTMGSPLGIWGYAFRGLEIIGFALGGLVVPAAMFKKPYCDGCRRYMKGRTLAMVPGSVPAKKTKKSDTAGRAEQQAEQEKALAAAQELLAMLRQMALEGRADEFLKAIEPLKSHKKKTTKLPIRYRMGLAYCSKCQSGWLRVWQMTGQGKQLKQTELARGEATPQFVAVIAAGK